MKLCSGRGQGQGMLAKAVLRSRRPSRLLARLMAAHGRNVAARPALVAALAVATALALSSGLLHFTVIRPAQPSRRQMEGGWLQMITDLDESSTPLDAPSRQELLALREFNTRGRAADAAAAPKIDYSVTRGFLVRCLPL